MSVTLSPSAAAAPAASWQSFRILLDNQRAACVHQRELALAETATSMPDPVAMSRAGSLLRTIEEIDAALQRITDGRYGICTHCGGDIPLERLEFRPHASTCVACPQPGR
jgi:DnaK suppressor protein